MLHETTQRRVCRIVFVVGCLLPTICVVIATARVWLPSYASQWEQPLGQLLDCRATMDHFDMPRPGIVRCERVVLADAETNAPWAVLHGVSHEVSQGRSCMAIARAEIVGGAAVEIGARVERLLRGNESSDVAVTVGSLVVASKSQSLTLRNIRLQIKRGVAGSQLQLWSPDSADGIRLLVSRNRQIDPPATQVVLQTGPNAIPCELLLGWDRFEELGQAAAFRGRMELFATRESHRGSISGCFTHLDGPPEIAVNELHWGTDPTESLFSQNHFGPVAALLSQLPRRSSEGVTSDIDWQLAPFSRRPNAAASNERIVK